MYRSIFILILLLIPSSVLIANNEYSASLNLDWNIWKNICTFVSNFPRPTNVEDADFLNTLSLACEGIKDGNIQPSWNLEDILSTILQLDDSSLFQIGLLLFPREPAERARYSTFMNKYGDSFEKRLSQTSGELGEYLYIKHLFDRVNSPWFSLSPNAEDISDKLSVLYQKWWNKTNGLSPFVTFMRYITDNSTENYKIQDLSDDFEDFFIHGRSMREIIILTNTLYALDTWNKAIFSSSLRDLFILRKKIGIDELSFFFSQQFLKWFQKNPSLLEEPLLDREYSKIMWYLIVLERDSQISQGDIYPILDWVSSHSQGHEFFLSYACSVTLPRGIALFLLTHPDLVTEFTSRYQDSLEWKCGIIVQNLLPIITSTTNITPAGDNEDIWVVAPMEDTATVQTNNITPAGDNESISVVAPIEDTTSVQTKNIVLIVYGFIFLLIFVIILFLKKKFFI